MNTLKNWTVTLISLFSALSLVTRWMRVALLLIFPNCRMTDFCGILSVLSTTKSKILCRTCISMHHKSRHSIFVQNRAVLTPCSSKHSKVIWQCWLGICQQMLPRQIDTCLYSKIQYGGSVIPTVPISDFSVSLFKLQTSSALVPHPEAPLHLDCIQDSLRTSSSLFSSKQHKVHARQDCCSTKTNQSGLMGKLISEDLSWSELKHEYRGIC